MDSKMTSDPVNSRIWPAFVYLVLIALGVPWYWPQFNHSIVLGVPGWVMVAIVVSFVASVFTAWLLWQPWPGESVDSRDSSDSSTDGST